jgi:CHAT domain-containing protein/tetratricopeptide (TPR) repeat protein
MANDPPREHSSGPSPALDELLLQVENLKQSNNIAAYISLLQQILQLPSLQDDPSTWAALQFALGNALHQNAKGDRKPQLVQAIACYKAALTVYTREHIPANWVVVQQYRGSALCDLAELQEGEERLETLKAIVTCCDDILTVCTRETTPTNWAVAQYHKAEALYERAESLNGEACIKVLHQVFPCYDAALTVYTLGQAPLEWAAIQNGKGMAFYKLAQLHEGKMNQAYLQEALTCYNNALLVYDADETLLYRAGVQHNKGTVLHDLAELQEGPSKKEVLENALAYFAEALTIYAQEDDRLNCAREQSSKGNVLYDLSKIVRGAEHRVVLDAALDAYDAALDVYTPQVTSSDWAMVQNNKGNLFLSLAEQAREKDREGILRKALNCCDGALTIYTPDQDAVNWGITLRNKGNILRALSELLSTEERKETLLAALACFDTVLSVPHNQVGLLNWARTQNDKGLALHVLSRSLDASESREALQMSLACYDAALAFFTRHNAPGSCAEIQDNKSVSLSGLAELLVGEKRRQALQSSLTCCNAALTAFTPTNAPYSWALTQSNKGNVLRKLAEMDGGADRLDALRTAIACYDEALTVFSREESPLDWARTQHNKGAALRSMTGLLAGSQRLHMLRTALACYDAALLERTREMLPFDWAATQESKGNAFLDLAELLEGDEQEQTLQAALACLDAALLERQRVVSPMNWARIQNNRGNVLRHIARTHRDTDKEQFEILSQALECYDAALLEYRRELAPVYWAMTQSNKGIVLNDLARITEEQAKRKELLQAAIACFDAALLEYQSEVDPATWAILQVNKGGSLCNLAGLQEGETRSTLIRQALFSYDAALDIYTLDAFPAHHHRIAYAIGMRLFDESEWDQSAKYLEKALDALDDLYTLEVTARGRRATLLTSGELTAHLAYALVRAGGASGGLQAAEALERGRARATGEAMARQEAQLAAAERLAPALLEQFREASNQLAAIALKDGGATPMRETLTIAEGTAEIRAPLELAAMSALEEQLVGYEEARQVRASYDEVVALIRQSLPDFLHPNDGLEAAAKELRADERLTYVAATPVGAIALLISSSSTTQGGPLVERWWDEQLTSTQLTQLLVGSSGEDGKRGAGLLAPQAPAGQFRQALRRTMQMLGASDGVLARLLVFCRTSRIHRLVFVPCGLLGLLPLHAALVPLSPEEEAAEPLLDVVQMSYAPSARIWAASRRRAIKAPASGIEALIVADPQPQSEGTPPLAGAREEAKALATLISSVSGRISALAGEEAMLPEVLVVLRRREATLTHLHFACHGLAELADPQTSGILLAYEARLMTRDLLNPEFVRFAQLRLGVLAACRTALVGTELPDEAVGLPSAWLQAGAQDVLASLWPVSDSRTVALMTKFYELHLLDECEPVEALWLAQRWLRGLPSWREDCRAAGAVRAAEGPEANEIVFEQGKVRVRGRRIDDRENHEAVLVEGRGVAEEGIKAISGRSTENQDAKSSEQQWFWEDARHWAAFAIYGA